MDKQYDKDPFDRLLISTAVVEGLTIITADENIQKYDVSWVW
jgi:PIN domain nuclease of toxin-antitoxin system